MKFYFNYQTFIKSYFFDQKVAMDARFKKMMKLYDFNSGVDLILEINNARWHNFRSYFKITELSPSPSNKNAYYIVSLNHHRFERLPILIASIIANLIFTSSPPFHA